MKKVTTILEYLNRYKLAILLIIIVLFMIRNTWLSTKNSRTKTEEKANVLIEQQKQVEKKTEEMLDTKEPEELTKYGRMW